MEPIGRPAAKMQPDEPARRAVVLVGHGGVPRDSSPDPGAAVPRRACAPAADSEHHHARPLGATSLGTVSPLTASSAL